jgi:hypothetical protein
LSLLTDGSKDNLLKIQDLLDIIVGDWQQAPKGFAKNPTVIPNNASELIEVDEGFLYTAQEVAEGITIKEEKEDGITISYNRFRG